MAQVVVACRRVGSGWTLPGRAWPTATRRPSHAVTVATADLERLDPGATDPTDLVRRSFEFLLEREPKESILRTFDLHGHRPATSRTGSVRRVASRLTGCARPTIAAMCEHFVARAAEPFRIDELWPFSEKLERFGHRRLRLGRRVADRPTARSPSIATCARSATTPAASAVGSVETTSLLVHLRRPSRLSTLGTARHPAVRRPGRALCVQPQRRPARLPSVATPVPARRAGSTAAPTRRSGARWLEDAWHDGEPVGHLLGALHDTFGGQANLAVLDGGRHALSLRRQRREPGLHVPARPDRAGLDRDLLARSVALPVRRTRRDRPSPRPAPIRRSGSSPTGPCRRGVAPRCVRPRTGRLRTVQRPTAICGPTSTRRRSDARGRIRRCTAHETAAGSRSGRRRPTR